jgi:hypothetical protein
MATQSIQGLFGGMGTPEEMQNALLEQRASKFATLTPDQQLGVMGYKGGANLGQGLAGAFGVNIQDPTIKKATMLRQMASQFDTNTVAGLKQMAAALQGTDPELGYQVMQRAQAMEMAQAKLTTEQATATAKTAEKLTPEERNAAAIVNKRSDIISGSPQWNEAYRKELERLTAKAEGKINYGAEADRAAKAKYGKNFSELTQGEASIIDTLLESRNITKAKAGAGKPVDVASIIKEIGTKEDIKGKSEAWKAAGDAYKTQVPMIEKLKEVKNNLPSTFTGTFSETALQFGKALSAFGVPVDENKLSNTEYMNSVSSQVLQTIARNFPGSLAVKEMDQLVKSKFSSPQQIKTIARILGDLQTEIESGTKSYEQLAKLPETERYSKDLNLLTGQNYTKLKRYRALEDKAKSLKPGQTMTKAEVEEAKKLQQEVGVE